jgi:hypothetical protein
LDFPLGGCGEGVGARGVCGADRNGGGGANEGKKFGFETDGRVEEAKACRKTIDACFLDSTGYATDQQEEHRIYTGTRLIK